MKYFSKKHIFFMSVSTIVEWYDFMLFIYLNPLIRKIFFPNFHRNIAIIIIFGIFAFGFLMGPIGSIVMGSFGDRFGRKRALVVSNIIMILPILIIIFLPTYRSIGIFAPSILIIMRLLHGFSVGGSYGGAMVFMIESSQLKHHGFIASFATMSSGTGVFLASLIAILLFKLFNQRVLNLWGWRLGYVFGLFLMLVSLIMRLIMPESYSFKELESHGNISIKPVREMFKKQTKSLFLAISLSAYANIIYYLLLSYLSDYFIELNYSEFFSLIVIAIFSLIFSFSAPFWGLLSDYLGRKPLIKFSIWIYLIVSYPSFILMNMGIGYLFIGMFLLTTPLMAIWGAYGAAGPELFNTKYRYSGNGFSYNIGNSFFGSITPFIATLLIAISNNILAPAYILILSSIIMIPILYYMPETRYNDSEYINFK